MKLERDFGISGPLLDWLKSYLKERQQFTAVYGSTSEMIPISFRIPQGSVLGPTLFTLFTNDLPSSVSSGSVYMFADDTYLLLTEFSVCTVNYGPSFFFHRFMAQARSARAINRWKKTGIRNLQYGRKKRG